MTRLKTLLDQQAARERQISEARRSARAQALARIRALMSNAGLTVADIGGEAAVNSTAKAKSGTSGKKVAPKYRDQTTGALWTGRGRTPLWLVAAQASGQPLSAFKI
jgi:DNA-binding protein H-NS